MDLGLKDKVAIVGGGSRGLGKAIAARLVAEGARVAIIARHQEELDKTAHELDPQKSGKVLPIAFDLSELKEIPKLISKVKEQWKFVHVLVNNAGGPKPGRLEDVSDDDWDKALTQNLKSAIVLTREVIPLMKAQKFGRIINIASYVAKEPSPSMILSNTARTGVVAFAKTIAQELASFNVTVNTLCPGPILTDRMQFLIQERAKKEGKEFEAIKKDIQASIPAGRLGTPDEFASVAVFLASERASYITGTAIAVDGGLTKGLF